MIDAVPAHITDEFVSCGARLGPSAPSTLVIAHTLCVLGWTFPRLKTWTSLCSAVAGKGQAMFDGQATCRCTTHLALTVGWKCSVACPGNSSALSSFCRHAHDALVTPCAVLCCISVVRAREL